VIFGVNPAGIKFRMIDAHYGFLFMTLQEEHKDLKKQLMPQYNKKRRRHPAEDDTS
jgi:hypothetical protein